MALNHLEVKLKQTASYLGIVQSLMYILLSVTCLIIYYRLNMKFEARSWRDVINIYIYSLYLDSNRIIFNEHIVTPVAFAVFAWGYLILNCGLFVASCEIYRKHQPKLDKTLKIWGYLVIIICAWDFIVVLIFGLDYSKCLVWARESANNTKFGKEEFCVNGILPVLVIAAKGFVLWIINFIFGLTMFKMSMEVLEKRNQGTGHFSHLFDVSNSS